MLSAIVPLVVAVAGALLYALAANPKLARMGELAFFAGLFWLVYVASRITITIG